MLGNGNLIHVDGHLTIGILPIKSHSLASYMKTDVHAHSHSNRKGI